ncbi:MAG: outer membrane beta-barrel protein [Massilibacteroides sp.]|nr:outer membrane beta-barrel protein [Massilibacteroides sp.]MDD3061277.1 outer membrane beta-barrel protein [Massilibacteroides sp.]MDD4114625.1 outer membrane beta-barrel protein [Massilibacteroides sp.]MDD4659774.1 outer membrane beta-barrel protein [Massilibacteroides sp.]
MKIDDRDKIDDLFRSKLYDFESDALPDEVWGKIEGHLNKQRYTLSSTRWRWWVAAAAVTTLLLIGNVVYFFNKESVNPIVAEQIGQKTDELKSTIREQENIVPGKTVITPQIAEAKNVREKVLFKKAETKAVRIEDAKEILPESIEVEETISVQEELSEGIDTIETNEQEPVVESFANQIEESVPVSVKEKIKTKRWSFGMGAGSITAGSSDAANLYAFRNTTMENIQLDFLNSVAAEYAEEAPKTDIKHRQPISVGFSVSYMLTSRWYLLAGLNYSYLSSDWKTNGNYFTETEQRLHFVGLPISLAYKIAEWNSFMWYASAGFMPEINVTGRVKETRYVDDQILGDPIKTHVRMKDLYWSVNAATGVSYPIFRFLNVFAEVGAGYYFDNGSKMETVHSDKPFNFNLSVGLRLGF